MNPQCSRRRARASLSGSIITILLLLALVSCGQPDPSLSAQPPPEVLTETSGTSALAEETSTPAVTPTLTGPEEAATIAAIDARRVNDLATVEAGGVLPTPIGGETPIVLDPPEELPFEIRLGIHGDCADPNPVFAYGGCWSGQLDGMYVFVAAGPLKSDYAQGMVRVYTNTLDLSQESERLFYPTPRTSGLVSVEAELFPHLRLQAQDGTVYLFNVLTRTYEQTIAPPILTPLPPTPRPYRVDRTEVPFTDDPLPPTNPPAPTAPPTIVASSSPTTSCVLYPLALQVAILDGVPVGQLVHDLQPGQARGNIGWLSWMGEETTALLEGLTPPGTSGRYTNPDDPTDRTLSVGDWVRGHPGARNSRSIRETLDLLRGRTITVPVWDTADRPGGRLRYHVIGFAHIELVDHQWAEQPRLAIRSLGPAACP